MTGRLTTGDVTLQLKHYIAESSKFQVPSIKDFIFNYQYFKL